MNVTRQSGFTVYSPLLPDQPYIGRIALDRAPDAAWAERFADLVSPLGGIRPALNADVIEMASGAPEAVQQVDGLIALANAGRRPPRPAPGSV